DRSKAPVIMDLLKRQLLSPRYIQHSARVLFELGQANAKEREQILQAIFDLSREEIVKRVHSGSISQAVLDAYDYIYDVFPEAQQQKPLVLGSRGKDRRSNGFLAYRQTIRPQDLSAGCVSASLADSCSLWLACEDGGQAGESLQLIKPQ